MKKLGRPRLPRAICPQCGINQIERRGRPYCSKACSNRSRRLPLVDRFLRYYHPGEPDTCWPWTGTIHHNGYGVIGDEQRKQCQAHRVAYELAKGPIPVGLEIMHSCDNPPCCNPAHLSVGTHAENNKDKTQKGRTPHGANHPRAKITEEDVRTIRAIYRGRGVGRISQQRIANHYGLHQTIVSDIIRRVTWKHA